MKLKDKLQRKPLFNPKATDNDVGMINTDTTNLVYLANAHYPWAKNLYKAQRQNFWNMEMIDLTGDLATYKKLNYSETMAYDGIISYLIFLDSLQTNNLGNVTQYISAPEVVICLTEANAQEGLHTFSYQTILETAVPPDKIDSIYYFWREDKVLEQRCEYIASLYQANIDNPSNKDFLKVLMADLLLEGLYFWVGFYYFFSLSSRGLMMGTADTIRRIMRDELTHITLFRNMLLEIIATLDDEDKEWFREEFSLLINDAVEQEISWWMHIVGNEILGFNEDSITQFVRYVAHKNLCSPFGLDLGFGSAKHPYKHLDLAVAVEDSSTNKGNFFEGNSNAYQQATFSKEDDEW